MRKLFKNNKNIIYPLSEIIKEAYAISPYMIFNKERWEDPCRIGKYYYLTSTQRLTLNAFYGGMMFKNIVLFQ